VPIKINSLQYLAVLSFNTRESSDVTTAFGFTLYNSVIRRTILPHRVRQCYRLLGRTGNVTLATADIAGAATLLSPTFSGTPAAPFPEPVQTTGTVTFVGHEIPLGCGVFRVPSNHCDRSPQTTIGTAKPLIRGRGCASHAIGFRSIVKGYFFLLLPWGGF
jgi:hypothetical protein